MTADEVAKTCERQKPWGTVHAVLCAQEKIHEPFAIINSDDYYGREAFKTLGQYLSSIDNNSTQHAMVGYVLGKTMSKSGSVSRGVCSVKDGLLDGIVENTKIYYGEGGKIFSDLDDKTVPLTGNEWVSMNLFGFSPKAFEGFNEYWENFKKEGLYTPKKEALLPEAAGQIVQKGEGVIKFFSSTESWFGMTYPEDREIVKNEIAAKIAQGYYPERLWNK